MVVAKLSYLLHVRIAIVGILLFIMCNPIFAQVNLFNDTLSLTSSSLTPTLLTTISLLINNKEVTVFSSTNKKISKNQLKELTTVYDTMAIDVDYGVSDKKIITYNYNYNDFTKIVLCYKNMKLYKMILIVKNIDNTGLYHGEKVLLYFHISNKYKLFFD